MRSSSVLPACVALSLGLIVAPGVMASPTRFSPVPAASSPAGLLHKVRDTHLSYSARAEALRFWMQSAPTTAQAAVVLTDLLRREAVRPVAGAERTAFLVSLVAYLNSCGDRARSVEPVVRQLADRSEPEATLLKTVSIGCLGNLGDARSADIDYLCRLLEPGAPGSQDLIAAALTGLRQIGAPARSALPLVAIWLRTDSPPLQALAYQALGAIQAGAYPAAPDKALAALGKKDLSSPEAAAAIFCAPRRDARKVSFLSPLIRIARNRDLPLYIRIAAVQALGKIGFHESATAIPCLIDCIAEEKQGLVTAAGNALKQVRPGDPGALRALVEGMRVDSYYSLNMILYVLGGQMDPVMRSALPWIMDALRAMQSEEPGAFRAQAYLSLLEQYGAGNQKVADFLIRMDDPHSPLVADPNDGEFYEYRILHALNRIGGLTAAAVPGIRHALRSRQTDLSVEASRAAETLGPAAAAALPELTLVLEDDDFDPAGRTDPGSHDGTEGTGQADAGVSGLVLTPRMQAMRALVRIGPSARARVLPALRQLATRRSADPHVMEEAIQACLALTAFGEPLPSGAAVTSRTGAGGLGAPVAASPLVFTDIAGRTHALPDPGCRATVFVFAETICPSVAKYSGRMRAFARRFGPQGVRLVTVFSHPGEDQAKVSAFCRAQGYQWDAVCDQSQTLLRQFRASCAMEAFLVDADGRLRYHGRVDDSPFSAAEVKRQNLIDAAQALLEGRPIPIAETRALGCAIPTPATAVSQQGQGNDVAR